MTVEKRHQVALQAWRRVLSIAEAHGYRIIHRAQATTFRALLDYLDQQVDQLIAEVRALRAERDELRARIEHLEAAR